MTTQSILTGDDLRELMEYVLPEDAITELVQATKFQERTRKRDAVGLIRALVIAASTGYGGRQRDVARVYFENGAPKVARGGFYAWFGPQLEETMAGLSQRAMEYARAQPLDVPPLMLRHARDWHIVDATTVKLPDELIGEYLSRSGPVRRTQGAQEAVGRDRNGLPVSPAHVSFRKRHCSFVQFAH